jgi:ligand-binding sensor domain-containing protein
LPFTNDHTRPLEHPLSGIYIDDSGEIWVTYRSGLIHIKNGQCTILETNTPGTLWCQDMAVDRGNKIWFGSPELSVPVWSAYYNNGQFTNCNGIDEKTLYASRIKVDSQDRKWFLTDDGIIKYNGKTWEMVFERKNFTHGDIETCIIGPDDALWFGSIGNGLWKWDGITWTNFTIADGLPTNTMTPRLFGPDGTLWCATGEGIAWFDGRSWMNSLIDLQWGDFTVGIDGTVWAATYSGLLRFDGAGWKNLGWSPDTDRNWTMSLAVDARNVVWLATWDGIFRYDGQKWKHYTTADGLPYNAVNFIVVDRLNRKWFSTQRGICMLDDSAPDAVKDLAPNSFAIQGNFPNPFNPSTTIEYTLPHDSEVRADLYSVTGQRIRTLFSGKLAAGKHFLRWDGKNDREEPVASGVYLVEIRAGDIRVVHSMMLLR